MGDIRIGAGTAKAKLRADSFTNIYDWIAGAKYLFIRVDRRERLVAMGETDFTTLLKTAKTKTQKHWDLILVSPAQLEQTTPAAIIC